MCIFGSMLCNISKRDAKECDVVQILAQRCQPKRHKITALAIEPSFSMVENAKIVDQLLKILMIHQAKKLTHIFPESDWPDNILSGWIQ